MKEIILIFAMQFSQDFNKPIDNIEYRTGNIEHFALILKKKDGFEIVIDKDLKDLNHKRLKTLVYHLTGKATGMELSKGNDFMNPENIIKPYNRLK